MHPSRDDSSVCDSGSAAQLEGQPARPQGRAVTEPEPQAGVCQPASCNLVPAHPSKPISCPLSAGTAALASAGQEAEAGGLAQVRDLHSKALSVKTNNSSA